MILVSACLAGDNCNYKGNNNKIKKIKAMVDKGLAIKVCPEVLGGLSTPREPAEISNNKVITKSKKDVTKEFLFGAYETLKICKKYNCKKAILKEKSPSCGTITYDGTFSKSLINKPGITAKILMDHGIEVISSEKFI